MAQPPPSYNARRRRSLMYSAMNDQIVRTGRWMVFVRRDIRFRCSCYDPIAGIPSVSQCPECFGTGYKVTLERIHCGYSQQPNLVPQSTEDSAGYTERFPATALMRALSFPQELDLLFEVEWNVPYDAVPSCGAPTSVYSGWVLRTVIPIITEAQGMVDFFGIGLDPHSLDRLQVEQQLRSAGPKIMTTAAIEEMTLSQRSPRVWNPGAGGLGDRYPQLSSPDAYRKTQGRGLGYASRQSRPGL